MKKREIVFGVGVYGVCFLVIMACAEIMSGFVAKENSWLVYLLAFVFAWPEYLSISKKTNILRRNEVKDKAITDLKWYSWLVFLATCIGLLLGYFTNIVEFTKIRDYLIFFSVLMFNHVLGGYAAYLFWQPKSVIALNDCMKLFLLAEDGSRAKARWRKMLLKNFDADGLRTYDNPYTWRVIIDRAIVLFGSDEQKTNEIEKLFLEVKLSADAMSNLEAMVKKGDKDKEYWDEETRSSKPIQEKALAILRNKVKNYFARQ